MKKIKYFIPIYILLGLFVSSIGMTWCHYQVSQDYTIQYLNKTAGEYQITDYSDTWQFDSSRQIYINEFIIYNRNKHTNFVNIVLNTTQKADYTMIVLESSGREVSYDSILVKDEEFNYNYKFIDKDGNEVKLECQEKAKSKLHIRLEVAGIVDAFLTEVILEDASYDIQTNNQITTGQYNNLIISSNYLFNEKTYNVLVEQRIIDIVLDSNMVVNAKIKTNDANALLNENQEIDLTLNPQVQTIITLDVTNVVNDSVVVELQILDDQNSVVKTYKTNFIVNHDVNVFDDYLPIIEMNYINDKKIFNKFEPIEFMIKSDMDTVIQIGDTYPPYTCYSYDEGKTWYMTTTDGELVIPLISNQPTKVVIDLSKSMTDWGNKPFKVNAKSYDILFEFLDFEMQSIDIPLLEVTNSKMGIITLDDCSFTINTKNVLIIFEKYSEGQYVPLTEEYFTLESEDSLSYVVKQNDINIPRGIYKIKIQQLHNEKLIKEEVLSFFTIEEANS